MLDDRTKQEIERSIFTAYDRYSIQYYKPFFESLKTGSLDQRVHEYDTLREEQLFLSKRALVPGFARYVTRQVQQNASIQRQKHTLLKATLISILRPEGVTIEELEKKVLNYHKLREAASNEDAYTRRHIQRLVHEVYSESFFKAGNVERNVPDERLASISSVFSSNEMPMDGTSTEALQYYKTSAILTTRETVERIWLNAHLNYVTPEFLADLLEFRDQARTLLKEIGEFNDRGTFLSEELERLSPNSLVFHAHFLSILSLEWFRRRQPSAKRRLIQRGFPLRYSSSDASKARELLATLLSAEMTRFLVQEGAMALQHYSLPQCAIELWRQCLKLDEKDDLALGTTHENIAVVYRDMKRPKLMVAHMKNAMKYLQKAGDLYRVALATKNLAEAEWSLGFKELAAECFLQAENLANKLQDPKQQWVITFNLARASQRIGDRKMELQYLKKCLVGLPEDCTDQLLYIEGRLDRLVN